MWHSLWKHRLKVRAPEKAADTERVFRRFHYNYKTESEGKYILNVPLFFFYLFTQVNNYLYVSVINVQMKSI